MTTRWQTREASVPIERRRRVARLRSGGATIAEIARAEGVSVTTVSTAIRDGKLILEADAKRASLPRPPPDDTELAVLLTYAPREYVRTLKRLGANTLGELRTLGPDRFLNERGMGPKGLYAIIEELRRFGSNVWQGRCPSCGRPAESFPLPKSMVYIHSRKNGRISGCEVAL
jgi:transposase-like protein